jgi:NAD-dependent deacetylase
MQTTDTKMTSTKPHIVFLTGAGMSQESGITTFRDLNGMWENHNIEEVASPEGFTKNPQRVLDFYNARRKQLDSVVPNEAHLVMAQLENRFRVTVLTQNVDDLHERAGSTAVVHLHGELKTCRSCENETLVYPYDNPLKIGDLASDGHQLRPNVVWFGEMVPNIEQAIAIVQSADLFVIVGTSMSVHPAASLLLAVPYDVETVYIDPQPEVEEGINLLVIKEKASVGMKLLAEEVLP